MTDLLSASSCPSTSNRNLFRGFGAEPGSRHLLKERSPLLTIWLIFWNRLGSCRQTQNPKRVIEGKESKEIVGYPLICNEGNKSGSYPEGFPD